MAIIHRQITSKTRSADESSMRHTPWATFPEVDGGFIRLGRNATAAAMALSCRVGAVIDKGTFFVVGHAKLCEVQY